MWAPSCAFSLKPRMAAAREVEPHMVEAPCAHAVEDGGEDVAGGVPELGGVPEGSGGSGV